MNKNALTQATKNMNPTKFYHGSATKISDGYLRPNKQFNNLQDKVVSAVFVTSAENRAKFFAIGRCISGGGHLSADGKTPRIYFEKLSCNIKPYFYIYTVYEDSDNHFTHDIGTGTTEYYATKPIRIAKCHKYNTAQEIEKFGYEIYVLDEPLMNKFDLSKGENSAVRQEMRERIAQGKFHRVDIAKMIAQQSAAKSCRILAVKSERGND